MVYQYRCYYDLFGCVSLLARVNLNIGIAYSSNPEHVIAVINKTGNDLANDPLFEDAILKPPNFLLLKRLATLLSLTIDYQ
jgi:small-conductance mechanosensitive channel